MVMTRSRRTTPRRERNESEYSNILDYISSLKGYSDWHSVWEFLLRPVDRGLTDGPRLRECWESRASLPAQSVIESCGSVELQRQSNLNTYIVPTFPPLFGRLHLSPFPLL